LPWLLRHKQYRRPEDSTIVGKLLFNTPLAREADELSDQRSSLRGGVPERKRLLIQKRSTALPISI
jgi:hypothetical protein